MKLVLYTYISFEIPPLSYSCRSFIGRLAIYHQPQGITLGANCVILSTVIHEIGHAIGFYHEHTRHDRDKYIRVFRENVISPNLRRAFDKMEEGEANTCGYGYDYASIMHYMMDTFAKRGTKTMDSIPPNLPMGGKELSPLDIAKTNALYKCGKYSFSNIIGGLEIKGISNLRVHEYSPMLF